jgi:hypothetical protein
MTTFLFKKLLSFKMLVPNGISLTNNHLLIMDGNGSHYILQAIQHMPISLV